MKALRAMSWDVVVLGGVNSDYTVLGSRLPAPGATVEGETFLEGPGGKGANQAVAAARLGARVALLARVGMDARGDVLCDVLASEGVATDLISRDPQARGPASRSSTWPRVAKSRSRWRLEPIAG